MVLQHMIWPGERDKTENELYYHGTTEYTDKGNLLVKAGETISFNTYFNCFAGTAWKENTTVTQCEFQVKLSGKGILFLKEATGVVTAEKHYCGENSFNIPLNEIESKIYYIEVKAEEDTVLYAGQIVTSQPEKEIHLVLATCTYNRPEDIQRNLKLLNNKNRTPDNGEKVLDRIYVVDNARTLNPAEIENENTVLIPNPNTGGAGGFTRGLKEAMKDPATTHILLMDDDVRIEFEAIVRTKSMLQYIKKEKEEHFIGGAMFRRDIPYIMHAAGEIWNNGRIINPYKNTDLRTPEGVQKVTKPLPDSQTYAGWWYCCIPRNHVETKGYPLPFFLHCDDVEYGLRSGKAPVFLNGIAVWHEEFDDKRSSAMEYYDARNRLITNALYMQRGKRSNAALILAERFLASVLRYRYKDIELILLAVEDFLKGPAWLKGLDAEAYHKSLSGYGYIMQPLEEIPICEEGKTVRKCWTILRYFLPASEKAVLRLGALVGDYAGKKEVLLVDTKNKKGFTVKKSWKATAYYAGRLLWMSVKLFMNYKNIEKQWKTQGEKR